ncbi:C-Jun-amino-terminal kinase-interacting protein 3-like [Dysidea avara]|uniref:C-Jun-amino-terminal kinase-interacting protein 3-like n=1 Tax=Dysidea avara TaxID=196820 RepID=UPI003317B8B9
MSTESVDFTSGVGEEDTSLVSERVSALAQAIYEEFQKVVGQFGADSISSLAPLIVNVLESWDSALNDNRDHLAALEELSEENVQLVTQYEREKQLRRETEERALKVEDASDQEIKDLSEELAKLKVTCKENDTKMHSQQELIDRLEERYEHMKKEQQELKQRNIESVRHYAHEMEAMNMLLQAKQQRSQGEDTSEMDKHNYPGYHDFMSSSPRGAKKRVLPVAPQQRRVRTQNSLVDSFEESYAEKMQAERNVYSPEMVSRGAKELTPPNLINLAEESRSSEMLENVGIDDDSVEIIQGGIATVTHQVAEELEQQSLFAELQGSEGFEPMRGMDKLIIDNEELISLKNELTYKVDDLTAQLRTAREEKLITLSSLQTLEVANGQLTNKVKSLESELRKSQRLLEDLREKTKHEEITTEGVRCSRVELAKILRERNEYKEKYLSLMDQVRLNDELNLFKSKARKSRWIDYLAAMFSPAKRRQLEEGFHSPARRPMFGTNRAPDHDQEDFNEPPPSPRQTHPQASPAKRNVLIPTLKRSASRASDDMLLTSQSWLHPSDFNSDIITMSPNNKPTESKIPTTININTCRPMSYQEEGAKVLCAAAVNPAMFLSDYATAVAIKRENTSSPDASISLVWVCTSLPSLTKVSIVDVGAVGEVLDTFPVCQTPVTCITSVPQFNPDDPDVLASLSTEMRSKSLVSPVRPSSRESHSAPVSRTNSPSDLPSSRHVTMWIGSDSGVLYVHSGFSHWKKCIHADKLPAAITSIVHLKGKVFVLLDNAKVAVFRRFSDGSWDWDGYKLVALQIRKDPGITVSAMSAVWHNVWCSVGNYIYVVSGSSLKIEAQFTVHPHKRSIINSMLTVGDGVWVNIKQDSTLRLFHASSFQHLQDLDVGPSINRLLLFHSDRRYTKLNVKISSMVAAHNALWIATDTGVIVQFPFSTPTMVAEEQGWEVMKSAFTRDQIPEPLDVKTEEAVDVAAVDHHGHVGGRPPSGAGHSSPDSLRTVSPSLLPVKKPSFSPFCSVDQIRISIHCHVSGVKGLVCVPGVSSPIDIYEPLGGVYIGLGDAPPKPALFVMSCGEGHLDLRTAEKVIQTLNARAAGHTDLPSAASIISDKNYIMVWDIVT